MIEGNLTDRPNISVIAFDGLIVDLAKEKKAVALIRGLGAVSDFEHEFQMAQTNRHLDDSIGKRSSLCPMNNFSSLVQI